ncbi:MAG: cyclic nucleotide-binding domain-containing protein [Desulfobacteraceae bacterium]|nr:cyclic nucleotide-binding domain-containing protein [Desulfobacteraceae bacterium]
MEETPPVHRYQDGELIFEEGSPGEEVYVVQSGAVEISKIVGGKTVVIEWVPANGVFGELGFLAGSIRTATARAAGVTAVQIIDQKHLAQEFEGLSETFQSILKSLALRLKRTSEHVYESRQCKRIPKSYFLTFQDQKSLRKSYTGNICDEGLLIKTSSPLAKGERFPLKLELPGDPDPIQIGCEVVWSRAESDDPVRRPMGMGVKFVQISEMDRQRLRDSLED